MKQIVLIALAFTIPLTAGTPEEIAKVYNAGKITNNVTTFMNSKKSFVPAPSPAAQRLKIAEQQGKITSNLGELQTNNLKKYKNAIPIEMAYLYRSMDASSKVQNVKGLHSDLLSSIVQQNIIGSETLMLMLQEEFATSVENEFKKAKK
ncbi:MAG: hypothetical protein PHX54_09585 [Lentimicrobiaceae bacterium]|nr:hypothetical protein [Lentimicrobiaceae bacterium]